MIPTKGLMSHLDTQPGPQKVRVDTTQKPATMIDPLAGSDLAAGIKSVDEAVSRLLTSGLTRHAIVTLVIENSRPKVGRKAVETVLRSLETLGRSFLTKSRA